jgi:hypothetical protein
MVRHRLVRRAWVALPPLVVTLALAAFAVLETAGAHPLTDGLPRNAAEAVAMHDHAALLRFMASPSGARDMATVRKGILGDRLMFATPAEAAVLAHDRGALDLLASRGAWGDADRARLACLAGDVHDASLVTFFDRSARCEPGRTIEGVLRRP